MVGQNLVAGEPVERGALMQGWIALLATVVGWGVWLMPVGFAVLGLWLVFRGLGREWRIPPQRLWGGLILFVLGLALLHLAAGGRDAQALAAEGAGGGYVGHLLSGFLVSGLGTPGAVLVLVTLTLLCLILTLEAASSTRSIALSGRKRSGIYLAASVAAVFNASSLISNR